jgi:recombination protein RecT
MNEVAVKTDNPLVRLNEQLETRSAQFQAALPAHIPIEKFKRVVLTAVQQNPKLAKADRPTLFTSAMKAAQDGLLPDGREGALVIYNTKIKDNNGDEKWIDAVQWMPMVAGLRKKVRNSGEIATWEAHVVYEKDAFEFELGDDPYIKHKPFMGGDRGKIVAAYSVATLKSGEKSREVMSIDEIMAIWRKSSKAKDKDGNPTGPWRDHQGEMCRKTVARRHSKVLPMNTDLDDLIRRDDDLYDMEGASDKAQAGAAGVRRPQLSDFSEIPSSAPTDSKPQAAAPAAVAEALEPDEPEAEPEGVTIPDAMALGDQARRDGKRKVAPPDVAQLGTGYGDAWREGWDNADAEFAARKAAP